jgi:hypothetical protein
MLIEYECPRLKADLYFFHKFLMAIAKVDRLDGCWRESGWEDTGSHAMGF